MRSSTARIWFLFVYIAGALLFPSLLSAQQLGHYIGGFTSLENGSTAPPRFYAACFVLVEPINAIKDANGNTVLKPDIDVGGAIAAYSITTPKKILGAEYGFAFMVPVLNTRFTSNVF